MCRLHIWENILQDFREKFFIHFEQNKLHCICNLKGKLDRKKKNVF